MIPVIPAIDVKMQTTVHLMIKIARTPVIELSPFSNGYTDAQFYADIADAHDALDAMEAQALEDHKKGLTRKFPV